MDTAELSSAVIGFCFEVVAFTYLCLYLIKNNNPKMLPMNARTQLTNILILVTNANIIKDKLTCIGNFSSLPTYNINGKAMKFVNYITT